jgi:hypothetical protein
VRLSILKSGHNGAAQEALAALRVSLGSDVLPGSRATILYRPEFFGKWFADWLHPLMRGPSGWTVGERELMAAFVSKLNQCPW